MSLGPLRELRIAPQAVELGSDDQNADEGDGERKGADGADQAAAGGGGGGALVECAVELRRVGVAVIDAEPREVAYVSLQGLVLNAARSADGSESATLALNHLQVDSALDEARRRPPPCRHPAPICSLLALLLAPRPPRARRPAGALPCDDQPRPRRERHRGCIGGHGGRARALAAVP